MEENHKKTNERMDVYEPRFDALERLEDQYVTWLQDYRAEMTN